jgi:radical SAM protein with 4Fe4S-binding SPASM domain
MFISEMAEKVKQEKALIANYRHGLQRDRMRYPRYIFCEVTNRCNLQCLQCNRTLMSRPLGNMSLELFKKIVDESAPWIDVLDLNMWGEPLFNPDLIEMIHYAKSNGVKEVMLNTNGHLLNSEWSEQLIQSGLDLLTFSIDASTKATYRKIRVNGDFRRVIRNIENYLKIRDSHQIRGPKTIAQMILMRENRAELETFKRQWQGKTDLVFIRPLASMGDLKGIYDSQSIFKRGPTRTVCSNPWTAMFIFWDGKVVFCGDDINAELVMGDLSNQSVYDVWTSDIWDEHRAGLKQGDYPYTCRHCAEWAMCKPLSLPKSLALTFLPTKLVRSVKDIHMRISNGRIV